MRGSSHSGRTRLALSEVMRDILASVRSLGLAPGNHGSSLMNSVLAIDLRDAGALARGEAVRRCG